MSVREAIKKAEQAFDGLKVNTALDLGGVWVFGFCGQDGEDVDISPCSVDKKTGKIDVFFPPDHLDELESAKEVEI